MTDFEKIANVNVVNFIQILDNLNLTETFKTIYRDGGINHSNKKKLLAEMKANRDVTDEQKNYIRYEQDDKCVLCSKRQFQLPVDHIQPLFMGGSNERCNLQGLCEDCHKEKTASERMALNESIELAYKAFFSDTKCIKTTSNEHNITDNVKKTKTHSSIDIKPSVTELCIKTVLPIKSNNVIIKKNNTITLNKEEKYKCENCYIIYQNASGLRKHKIKNDCENSELVVRHRLLQETNQKLENNLKTLYEEKLKIEYETRVQLEKYENEISKLNKVIEKLIK